MHDGPPWYGRWPAGVISLAFWVIAYTTWENSDSPESVLVTPIWWVTAALIGVISAVFLFVGGWKLRKLSAAAIIAYGSLRAGWYVNQGSYVPLGVWLLVVGLTIAAYHERVRSEVHESI